ncbi:hypothetical protein [Pseudomonas mosselii]|uniref:hypothetical protein n=1 Tax=Pseudomonas mosselii TaxID=78327 RepID=UPI0021D927A4|nr:hypothetical protein [Pseudomonas mosselii]MCU9530256.1 hypothetical protein [Pseudomonas mosselii]MCU9537295.1 hypothetical protein [Pseudomonas mosselii]MCU9542328.1 hypothetical protein [Pseudomonas mosselii]MCU9549273.1 hypothetical protein [Pseudomonas mosselii]
MGMDVNTAPPPIPVSIMGISFAANEDRLWSLNEIHKSLELPGSKSPSEWRNAVSDELRASGNLRIIDKVGTFADELGTIAYAMWVSTSFYIMVAGAFVAMRNHAVYELRHKDSLLAANMPKASALDMKARGFGLTWTETCRIAGIQHPRIALDILVQMGAFVRHNHQTSGLAKLPPRPKRKGFEVGAFVAVTTEYGNSEGWRVKTRGLDWFRARAEEINLKVAEEKARRAREKRKVSPKRH